MSFRVINFFLEKCNPDFFFVPCFHAYGKMQPCFFLFHVFMHMGKCNHVFFCSMFSCIWENATMFFFVPCFHAYGKMQPQWTDRPEQIRLSLRSTLLRVYTVCQSRYMSHVMRKPAFCIYQKQRHKSAVRLWHS